MRIAVLPLNAAEGTSPAFGRQFTAFAGETLRGVLASQGNETTEIQVVNYLAQIDQDGEQRAAFVNVADTLVEYDFLAPLFEQAQVDQVLDGVLVQQESGFKMTYRFHAKDNPEPLHVFDAEFSRADLFPELTQLLHRLAQQAEVELPDALKEKVEFGTDQPEAFLGFLEGYDAYNYVNQSQGRVAREFSPAPAYEALVRAVELDPDFLAPYETLCALARANARFQIGTFEDAEAALNKLGDLVPADFRAHYSLGELYGVIGNWPKSADTYERALRLHEQDKARYQEESRLEDWMQEHASIFSRIGVAQMNQNMPVNAELNFKKAIDLEGDDKPSLQLLAQVLQMTNRAHEVPALWKQQMERSPANPEFHARYGIALMQAGRENDSVEVFENALQSVEENTYVKRFYAPILAQRGDVDRAMDFYEDCLDVAPTDIPLMLEYAKTLEAADRGFEIPAVLDNVLNANPDPNTRAEVLAWKIELTEPRRAEAVKSAEQKLEKGDFEGAIRELRPLRNWLADYWKMWAVLAAAHNRLEESADAQEAAERLLGLYPGCEPGYVELMAALSQQQKLEEAYNVMRYASMQIPGSLGIAINLALAAKRAGKDDEARALGRQIREAVGDNPDLKPVFEELEK